MWAKIKTWYEGSYEHPDNDPASPIVFVGGTYRRHWTARFASVLIEFWFKEWKWIIGTLIALVGLWLALKRLG